MIFFNKAYSPTLICPQQITGLRGPQKKAFAPARGRVKAYTAVGLKADVPRHGFLYNLA